MTFCDTPEKIVLKFVFEQMEVGRWWKIRQTWQLKYLFRCFKIYFHLHVWNEGMLKMGGNPGISLVFKAFKEHWKETLLKFAGSKLEFLTVICLLLKYFLQVLGTFALLKFSLKECKAYIQLWCSDCKRLLNKPYKWGHFEWVKPIFKMLLVSWTFEMYWGGGYSQPKKDTTICPCKI